MSIGENHDAARLGALFLKRRNHVETVAVAEPHIDHRVSRRVVLHPRQTVRDAVRGRNLEAAAFHGAREALQKRLIVVDDQKLLVGSKAVGGSVGHRKMLHVLLRGVKTPLSCPL